MHTQRIWLLWKAAVIVLALNLSACAALSPATVQSARVPPPPESLMEPPPQKEWSKNVQELLKKWQQMLSEVPPK